MKLYTKRGDDGSTDLFGGQRLPKDALRIEAYGTIDEINSSVGLAAVVCSFSEITPVLVVIQNRLFELGADLATPRTGDALKPPAVSRIGPEQIAEAERQIDAACASLPPMRNFILPGGTELAARLHAARTVCRRAERHCVALARQEPIGPDVIIYINRLGDLFFALARRANQLAGVEDVPWKPRG